LSLSVSLSYAEPEQEALARAEVIRFDLHALAEEASEDVPTGVLHHN